MKTTFEDFEKTALHANLVKIHIQSPHSMEAFLLAIKTAFLVGHQLGLEEARDIMKYNQEDLDEARAILTGEKE